MDKYTILIVLNTPLALYGLFSVFLAYKMKRLRRPQMLVRVLFWLIILLAIWFVKPITDWLYSKSLTATPPLSIFDVFIITGVVICFLLIGRAYSRISETEERLNHLHEAVSIELSKAAHTSKKK